MSRASRIAATIVHTGQDNWQYRSGYKHTQRVPGPIESDWQDGDLSWLGALLCGLSAVSVMLGIAWVVAEWMA